MIVTIGNPIPKVSNRAQLYEVLEKNMERSYEDIVDDSKLEPEQNIVKTYVLESNIQLNDLCKIVKNARIEKLDDYKFYRIIIEDNGYFYVDAQNQRFWKLYTLQKSNDSDKYFNKLISPIKSRLDNLWLPSGDMKKLLKKADIIRGLATKHDESPYYLNKVLEDMANKLSISGNGESVYELIEIIQQISKEDISKFENIIKKCNIQNMKEIKKILNVIRQLLYYKHFMKFTKSKIKIISKDDSKKYVLEDIYYWGKFTVKGTSIHEHENIISNIIEDYKEQKIDIIEDSLIDYTSDDWGDKLPLVYEFDKEIEDLQAFINGLLSLKDPFKIWGIAKQVEEDMYYLTCVDLHNGDSFSLEVTPWWMRLYLPKDSCGNTALRLLSNIQQTFDSETVLEVEKYDIRIK